MVAFYKEVCIIYGAEYPLHILWLCNFISGLVAQLGERSVRIREVVGSNPIRSTKQCKSEHLVFHKTLFWVCGKYRGGRLIWPTSSCLVNLFFLFL